MMKVQLFLLLEEWHAPRMDKSFIHEFLGISYSTARDVFKKHVLPFVEDVSKYGTHSIKSGTASNEGCRGLSDDLIDIKHAG